MGAEIPKTNAERERQTVDNILNFKTLEGFIKEGQLQYIEPSTLLALIDVESSGNPEAIGDWVNFWLGQITSIAIADIQQKWRREKLPTQLRKDIDQTLQKLWINLQVLKDNPKKLVDLVRLHPQEAPKLQILLSIAYLKIIELFYLRGETARFNQELLNKYLSSETLINKLASRANLKKHISPEEIKKGLQEIVEEIKKDENTLKKFLTIRRYNSNNEKIDWEILHKDFYALWILLLEKALDGMSEKAPITKKTKKEVQKSQEATGENLEKLKQTAKKATHIVLQAPSYIYKEDKEENLVNLWIRHLDKKGEPRKFKIDHSKGSPVIVKKGLPFLKVISPYNNKAYLLQLSRKDYLWSNVIFEAPKPTKETISFASTSPDTIDEITEHKKSSHKTGSCFSWFYRQNRCA